MLDSGPATTPPRPAVPGGYRAALRAARALADAAPRLLPGPASRVRENLRLAFGEADESRVKAIFRHFAEAAVDLAFFSRLFSQKRFGQHFAFEGGGLEHYRETRPPAAIFVTGHFGNWELYGAAFSGLGIPLAPVVRPPNPPWLARWIDRYRKSHGQKTIAKRHALPLALRALREGQCVAFLLDQAAGRYGVATPFFGRSVLTYTAPAALARKTGLPLYAGFSTRLGDGIKYRCFAEPVSAEGGDAAVTRRLTAILEGYVRERPEQWWWFHRRFKPARSKTRGRKVTPAGLPAEDEEAL